MKRLGLSLALALVLTVVVALPVAAATTQDVTVTATPSYVALTNSEASWAAGTVSTSTDYWWTDDGNPPAEPFVDGDMKSTITNTGSVSEDIDIKATNFTGGVGWTLTSGATGENTVRVKAGKTGDANEAAMVILTTGDQELVDSLAASGTKLWCMMMETPSSFTDGVEKSSTVTLTASVAD